MLAPGPATPPWRPSHLVTHSQAACPYSSEGAVVAAPVEPGSSQGAYRMKV